MGGEIDFTFKTSQSGPIFSSYSTLREDMLTLSCVEQCDETPVRLVMRISPPASEGGFWWEVECIATGKIYLAPERKIGREISEMEALAWAAHAR